MTNEETVQQQLTAAFPFLASAVRAVRARRIFADVEYPHFKEVLEYLIREQKFVNLCTMTGLDEGATLGVIYHLATMEGMTVNLHTHVPKENPLLQSVMAYFPSAEAYERELKDLLGFNVQGLPEGNRYPLTDDWPDNEFPLRKDWKPKWASPEEGK